MFHSIYHIDYTFFPSDCFLRSGGFFLHTLAVGKIQYKVSFVLQQPQWTAHIPRI